MSHISEVLNFVGDDMETIVIIVAYPNNLFISDVGIIVEEREL